MLQTETEMGMKWLCNVNSSDPMVELPLLRGFRYSTHQEKAVPEDFPSTFLRPGSSVGRNDAVCACDGG